MNMPLVLLNRRRRGGFNPVSLFSAGQQGFWLQPSDLTTMFQDRAGTTPVTTPGQTVGLRLDKSKGLVLGSELITNGDFSNGTTGWTSAAGATLSVDSGRLKVTLLSPQGWAAQSISTVIGASYRVDFTVENGSATGIYLFIGTANNNTAENYDSGAKANGTYTAIFKATATTTFIKPFLLGSAGNFALCDNISVKEIPGNHAVAPTDAARPTYGIEPKTGRRNLLTRTEEFGDAVWDKGTGGSISTNSAVAPDGTTTADVYTWASTTGSFAHLSQTVSGQNPAQNFTFSIWIKRPAGSGSRILRLRMSDVTTSTGESVQTTVTESWQRFSFTRASATNTGSIGVGLSQGASGTIATGDLLEVWGAQLELGSTATAYQRVGTAFDVTEAGVATVHYIQYDGTDDSFSTSSINFTATDKMSVFAGVRKLSDAALGMAAELSVDASANSGSFRLVMPGSAGYEYRQRGSLNATGAGVSSGFAAPITNVITGLGDISGDSTILRINGTQVAQSTSDQGTGNFGNYPLFIGRRNNTSLPFNGRDYGIIIVGKTASATEITNTESYLAANTSGVSI